MDPSELLFGVGSTLLQEGRAVDASDQTNYSVKHADARDYEDELSGSEIASEEDGQDQDDGLAAAQHADAAMVS